jgi:hypothetical protein
VQTVTALGWELDKSNMAEHVRQVRYLARNPVQVYQPRLHENVLKMPHFMAKTR